MSKAIRRANRAIDTYFKKHDGDIEQLGILVQKLNKIVSDEIEKEVDYSMYIDVIREAADDLYRDIDTEEAQFAGSVMYEASNHFVDEADKQARMIFKLYVIKDEMKVWFIKQARACGASLEPLGEDPDVVFARVSARSSRS